MPEQKTPRIFVTIASYRDPECQHTVKELFEHAAYPERVFVGIVWQFNKEEDARFFEVPYPRPEQVRVMEIDAQASKGACWARARGQTLWQGEEYTLQIDSHTRFEEGWDETLIEMLAMCDGPKVVLSTYPKSYTPPREITVRHTNKLVAKEFDKFGTLHIAGRRVPFKAPAPVVGAFVGACMLFGPSRMMEEVAYDERLYFFGEEITLSARLWTHGWDIYHPHKAVLYHYYSRKGRALHFTDHDELARELHRLSCARARHMLGMEASEDPEVLADIEHFGMGTARSLKEYQEFSGVDFARRHIGQAAYDGVFPASLSSGALPPDQEKGRSRA